MAYAVISGFTGVGASKATVEIGGASYDVYEFPADGSITVEAGGDVDYLIVGGGGRGGAIQYGGAGGGSGGDALSGVANVAAGSHSLVVGLGAGGVGSLTGDQGGGQDSLALGLTARGGGRGAGEPDFSASRQPPLSGGGGASRNLVSSLNTGVVHPTSYKPGLFVQFGRKSCVRLKAL
ncbi:glycine-rich domain-containing protein [Rhodovulum strictum]|uniref:Glycine-rich domain-containing protein n=1 Tax=Rhodovulum strictum TaxID=58314 RepID=A0A844B9E2_9RHOB|nr:hypothetical protein [Rhodovulum strictum]MRH22961.1 hypothetical protein [Rhodovulum strictum]